MKTLHWTLRDLELLPDDGNRYEIIDGELYVAKQPDWQHQLVCFQLGFLLETWNEQSLDSPLLPGFHCKVSQLFKNLSGIVEK